MDSKTRKITTQITWNLQVFVTRCLTRTCESPNKKEKVEMDGHTLRKNQHVTERQPLFWNFQGQIKSERPGKL
ncbi:hypothetical protein C0J52_02009 [Blattella germanica]|nr:hypothetical protein C0J52_02009 [Blattella germanica]